MQHNFVQLQIFLQLYLIELLEILTGLGLLWHAGLLHKLKSYEISGQIFGLISSFFINIWLRVVLDGMSLQEYPVNAGVPQGSIHGPTLFLLCINDLPDDVICDVAIYADDTTLYSKCDQASDRVATIFWNTNSRHFQVFSRCYSYFSRCSFLSQNRIRLMFIFQRRKF